MAIAKHKCDICKREVKPEELIACDECYHKIEKEHEGFMELFGKISVLIDENMMERFPLNWVFPSPVALSELDPWIAKDCKRIKDESPRD